MSASCSLLISFRLMSSPPLAVTGPPSSLSIADVSIEVEKFRDEMQELLIIDVGSNDEEDVINRRLLFASSNIIDGKKEEDCLAASDGIAALWKCLMELLSCLPIREIDILLVMCCF